MAGRDWRKIAVKLKCDRTSRLKSTILAFNSIRCLTMYIDLIEVAIFVIIIFSSKSNFNLL